MEEPQGQRIRIAAKRRSETQERLLLSGLIVASKKPTQEISIEEVYTHAETDGLAMVLKAAKRALSTAAPRWQRLTRSRYLHG
jgi:hypothetical protein